MEKRNFYGIAYDTTDKIASAENHKLRVERFNAWLRYRLTEHGVTVETRHRIHALRLKWAQANCREKMYQSNKALAELERLDQLTPKQEQDDRLDPKVALLALIAVIIFLYIIDLITYGM